MDGQQIGAGLGKVLDVAYRLVDHQMDVQEHIGTLTDGLDHRDPDGQVGHEAAVHDIHMEIVGAGNFFDIPLQVDEVSGEDRRSNFNHHDILAFQV